MNIVGKLLIRYRHNYDQTQKDLAEQLSHYSEDFRSVNTVTISRWETGATSPSISKKRALLRFLADQGCLRSKSGCREVFDDAYKKLYDLLGQLFSKRYQYIVGNYPDFGRNGYEIRSLADHPECRRHLGHLQDIERITNVPGYYTPTLSTLHQWCLHPGSLGIICERTGQNLGHFLMIKVSNRVAEEIAYHRRSEFDIAPEELRGPDEKGSYYIHALYGGNPRIAAIVNVEAYFHMLHHYDTIENIVIFSSRRDGAEVTKDYGIRTVARGVDPDFGFTWYGMLSPVGDILFSDNIVRMIF